MKFNDFSMTFPVIFHDFSSYFRDFPMPQGQKTMKKSYDFHPYHIGMQHQLHLKKLYKKNKYSFKYIAGKTTNSIKYEKLCKEHECCQHCFKKCLDTKPFPESKFKHRVAWCF